MVPLGQFRDTYIIAVDEDGLAIIDQQRSSYGPHSALGLKYTGMRGVPEIKDVEGGTKLVHVTFHVTEGPKVKIDEIDFVGNQAISDGKLVSGGLDDELRQAIANLEGLLAGEGATLADVTKTTVFLKSMDSFTAMNEVYGRPEYFGANPPARSTVEVARLPRDVLVEIEVVALV